ncbi:MAG: hypothetical protein J6T06_08010 [Victivallales bacterium]|nr:hypothetical protein [Victivallales bacterium]
MKLTTKANRIQQNIANVLRKGLPLAGLLSSIMVITSCDLFKKSSDDAPSAGYIPEPKTAEAVTQVQPTQEQATQEQSEEPAPQVSADKQPDSSVGQEINVSEAQSNKTPWVTTGTPKLPIVPNLNSEIFQKDFNTLIEQNLRTTRDANDAIENSLRASKINPE